MRQVDCASNVGQIRLQITGKNGSIFGANQQRTFTELVGAQQQAAIETAAEITESLARTSGHA
jgi:hypothetical protein